MPAAQTSLIELVKILRAGLLYFAFVFGAGFVLGILRVLVFNPRVGVRAAELIEAPLMITISLFVALFIVRKLSIPSTLLARLIMGVTGLALMLAAEFGLVLWLRGTSFVEYFSTRDPLTAGAYYLSLLIFAAMPVALRWKS